VPDAALVPDLHYTHPRLADIYDLDSPWGPDTDFYVALAGHSPIDVLDLGCGTGTLCDGLAGANHRVTGVDPAPAMLSVARRKPSAGQIDWVQSSAQAYRSDKRFDLIVMTGHAFQVLLTNDDVLAVFSTMRRHLRPGGTVAFESRNPQLDWNREWRRSRTWELPNGTVQQLRSDLSVTGALVTFAHTYRFGDEALVSTSVLRFMARHEIEVCLANSGLRVSAVYGDWDSSAFDPIASKEMIFVATA